MGYELTILGCGSAAPTSNTNPSAQLLKMAERFYLIDCGEGTQQQLRRVKARFSRINHIFISHLHGDHFFGLPGLLSSFHLLNRSNDLHVYGPPELEALLALIFKSSKTTLRYTLHFHPTQSKEKELLLDDGKVKVYSFPLKHSIETTGFLFEEHPKDRNIVKHKIVELNIPICDIQNIKNGKDWEDETGVVYSNETLTTDPHRALSYAYCSDTARYKKIAEWISEVDLLYHESTFLKEDSLLAKKTKHSTAEDAAIIANETGAKALLLGHYSVRYDDVHSFESEAEEIFNPVFSGKDGLALMVNDKGVIEI